MADLGKQLRDWVERDLRYCSWDRDVEVVQNEGECSPEKGYETRYGIHLYTETHRYKIVAVDNGERTYLGCTATSRKCGRRLDQR